MANQELNELLERIQVEGSSSIKDKLWRFRKDILSLPVSEKGKLLTANLKLDSDFPDIANLFDTKLIIDDSSIKEREFKPYVYVRNSYERISSVETVDILESVRQNGIAIGHPVILFAIQYWQLVLKSTKYLSRLAKTQRVSNSKGCPKPAF